MRKDWTANIIVSLIIIIIIALASLDCFILQSSIKDNDNVKGPLASWWLANAYLSDKKAPEIVVLGGSQVWPVLGADAICYKRIVDITENHRSYVMESDLSKLLNIHWKVFFAMLPEATLSDDLIIARALFSQEFKPTVIAITFTPKDFFKSAVTQTTEAAFFFSKYRDPGSLHKDLKNLKQLECNLPVKTQNNPTYDLPLKLPKPFSSVIPLKSVLCSEDKYEFNNNLSYYQEKYANPRADDINDQLSKLETLVKYINSLNIKIVVFNFPTSNCFRSLFSIELLESLDKRIHNICKKYNADYISAEKVVLPFEENELTDEIHLNLMGGLRWTRPLTFYTATKLYPDKAKELMKKVKYLE